MSSFYIKRNKASWSLFEEIWNDGSVSQKLVPKQAYPTFGLNAAATVDEARARVKQINKEKKLERQAAAKAARFIEVEKTYDEIYFPESLTDAFIEKIKKDSAGTDDYKIRLIGEFKFIQRMILKVKVLPHQYEERASYFYDYFAEERISVEYASEILSLLNRWGKFVGKRNASFFEAAPKIPKQFRKKIAKANRGKEGVRTKSDALTTDHLLFLKTKLPLEEFNWLHCSLWLGLRPSEVDAVADEGPTVVKSRYATIKVLEVNQEKIESEDEEFSLKYIPLLYRQQQQAIDLLKSKLVKRPRPKKLKEITKENIDTYSGRTGFTDLMMSLGQKEGDASVWLGHKSIKTTRESYKDASNVPFTPVDENKKQKGA